MISGLEVGIENLDVEIDVYLISNRVTYLILNGIDSIFSSSIQGGGVEESSV